MRKGLEKIIRKGKKIAKLSLLSLGLSLLNSNTKADVLLYSTIESTSDHIQTNRLVIGQKYILKVWADNTQETNKTVGFQWSFNTPFNILQDSIPQPTPWYTNELGPDFFDGFDMEKWANTVIVKDCLRATKQPFRSGIPLPRNGPTNRIGVLGVYPINNSIDAARSNLQIISLSAKAYTPQGNSETFQASKNKKLPLAVVPEEQTAPVLIFNPNPGEHNQVYVASPPNKQCILETSTNLKDWTSVYTNSPAGESLWYSYPTQTDSSARFFRSRVIE